MNDEAPFVLFLIENLKVKEETRERFSDRGQGCH